MGQTDLFSAQRQAARQAAAPLADRVRPRTLDELLGQDEIVGPGTLLRRAIETDQLISIILWGPPGSGKTTLARIIAGQSNRRFVGLSAVLSGVKELRGVVAEAQDALDTSARRTVLFIDEIHRFNKAQQDALLPHVETGVVTLIGATTENPSFEVISALLSRCRVFVLKPLEPGDLATILRRAVAAPEGLGPLNVDLLDEAATLISGACGGDARGALNVLELAALTATPAGADGRRCVNAEQVRQALQKRTLLYDKDGEQHFNLISALHKSLRGSDPQAALYWLARMLQAGDDPMYLARRLVRFASEDIGLADPQALIQALAAKDAVHFIGMPEGDTALAQAVVYLASCPKSNKLYAAMGAVKRDIDAHQALPVPLHIRNAPTALMKDLGYGQGYQYDHNVAGNVADQTYLPEQLQGAEYYRPGPLGFEKEIAKRMAYWQRLREEAAARSPKEQAAEADEAEQPRP